MDDRHPNNIFEKRVAAKLSQEALAGKIGVSATAVSVLELGKTKPNFYTLERLLDVFECSFRDLFPRTQTPSSGNLPSEPTLPLDFDGTNGETPADGTRTLQGASNAVSGQFDGNLPKLEV